MIGCRHNKNQVNLFITEINIKCKQPDSSEVEVLQGKPSLLDDIIVHRKNFGIEIPYLLENLCRYNEKLRKDWQDNEYLKDDNLFLRAMFGGIKNSEETPPQIFEGMNALEICLIEAGIFKRKYVFMGDFPKESRNMHQEPWVVSITPSLLKVSRIKKKGVLKGNLYEIVDYLLSTNKIRQIHNQYKRDWKTLSEKEDIPIKSKRFKRLNPYDPETLKDRMDYIEKKYPEAVKKLKEVLAKPFIPERVVVKRDKNGNPIDVRNREGYVTPDKTYRRSIVGKVFYNLPEYANQIYRHFQNKEIELKIK